MLVARAVGPRKAQLIRYYLAGPHRPSLLDVHDIGASGALSRVWCVIAGWRVMSFGACVIAVIWNNAAAAALMHQGASTHSQL